MKAEGYAYVAVRQVTPGLRFWGAFDTPVPLPEGEALEHIAHAIYDVVEDYQGRPIPPQAIAERIAAYTLGGGVEGPSHDKPPLVH